MKTMRPMTPFRTAARFAAAVALLLPARAAFAQPAAAGPGAGPPLFRPAPGSPFGPGAAPSDVAAADVNGDRKLDLVVSVPSAGFAVFLGDGTGGFMRAPASSARTAAGPSPHMLALGDVDGDRLVDLAVTSHDSHEVWVLRGDGLGGFWPVPGSPFAALSSGVPHNHGLELVDVDGDRKLDIVTSNAGDGSVSVLRGDGKGRFAPAPGSPFKVGRSPYPPALGDLDRDGRLDIVTPDIDSGTLTVLLGTKEGFRAAPGSPIRVTARPYRLALGDVDGDRNLDLAATHDDTSAISVLLGDGRGGFRPAPGSPFEGNRRGWDMALRDFDGDGRLDLAIAAPQLMVLIGDGKGRFAPASGSPYEVGSGVWNFELADLNADGALDLVTSDYKEERIGVLLGRRAPAAAAPRSPKSAAPASKPSSSDGPKAPSRRSDP